MKRFLAVLLCCLCLPFTACTEETPQTTTKNTELAEITDTELPAPETQEVLLPQTRNLPCPHDFGPWETVLAPQEGVAGQETRLCNDCGEEESRDLDPLPPHEHEYTETVYLPSCLEEGYVLKTCPCGDETKTDVAKAKGHIFGDWSIEKAPTTEEEGMEFRLCEECGIKETSPLEKILPPPEVHIHSYTETVYDPTCESAGYTLTECTCGDYFQTPGASALGHEYGEWYTALEPGFYAGLLRRDCLHCNEAEAKTIPALSAELLPEGTEPQEELPSGTVFYLNQRDNRWGDLQVGCGNIKNNGCGPTCIAMALGYFGIHVTPYEVAQWLYEYTVEFNRSFHGISAAGIRLALEHWNRTVIPIQTYEDMITHLNNGALIVGAQGYGTFVAHPDSSHCIILFDLTEEGTVTCYDSYTQRLSGSYAAELIWEERSAIPVDLRKEGVTHFAVY